ncbi:hypothetical protein SAMN04487846_0983 [Microbacterium sp. cf046]|uniref:hypothetical protein n=1 Tax=Microbacterium sp. cf046 TaxID=1761803 RepID=UPI0008DF00EB|nr:hypothetical protein [Microbacterium sp. cf046]SFR94587.1 hypothetical protein SAMN04487846_0983 [Microbacterium sp. cf046]
MTIQMSAQHSRTEHSRTELLESAHRDRLLAERALRRSELERDQAARALESNLAPSPIGEAARARLRATYADAAGSVERHRRAFDRALAIEQAADVLAKAFDDESDPAGHDAADNLIQLFASKRPGALSVSA